MAGAGVHVATCCCGCCSLKTGCFLVAALTFVIGSLHFGCSIFQLVELVPFVNGANIFLIALQALWILITFILIVSSILLVVGLLKRIPCLLSFWIVMVALFLTIFYGLLSLRFNFAFIGRSYVSSSSSRESYDSYENENGNSTGKEYHGIYVVIITWAIYVLTAALYLLLVYGIVVVYSYRAQLLTLAYRGHQGDQVTVVNRGNISPPPAYGAEYNKPEAVVLLKK